MTITSTIKPHIDELINAIDQLIVERIKQHDHIDHESMKDHESEAQFHKELIAQAVIGLLVHL